MKNVPTVSLAVSASVIALAVVIGGCNRSAKDEAKKDAESPSAKASSQALTGGTSDGTGKVYSKETAAQNGGPAPKVNPESTPLKVAGEEAGPGSKAPKSMVDTPTPPAASAATPTPAHK